MLHLLSCLKFIDACMQTERLNANQFMHIVVTGVDHCYNVSFRWETVSESYSLVEASSSKHSKALFG